MRSKSLWKVAMTNGCLNRHVAVAVLLKMVMNFKQNYKAAAIALAEGLYWLT